MPTIKRKVEMNLPELIEWGVNNPKEVESKIFESDKIDYFWNIANVQFSNDGYGVRVANSVSVEDTFTVEIEEEITEDTVLPKILVKTNYDNTAKEYSNSKINQFVSQYTKAIYIVNDDLTMTLIWTKEKGVVE
ncbi:hypothetical protein [Mammaliicoccus sciuri]|uniref:hypothetical protein n=1 Tax=Mammaliicoccus sciuri TaxID=1296 RepID=UPI001954522D|nr:hypothetical protein [Mammaliicoccus sciuri]